MVQIWLLMLIQQHMAYMVVCKPILGVSLSLSQAEQKSRENGSKSRQKGHEILPLPGW